MLIKPTITRLAPFTIAKPNHAYIIPLRYIVLYQCSPTAEGSMYVKLYTIMAIGNGTTQTLPYKHSTLVFTRHTADQILLPLLATNSLQLQGLTARGF